jgi:DNA-binding GntR family transcriptional regulator
LQIPKYLQIYNEIKTAIEKDDYQANGRLESGQVLASKYNTSLVTIKKALDLLVLEGLVIRRRGDGTIVKDKNYNSFITEPKALTGTYAKYKNSVQSQIIKFDITKPCKDIAHKLSLQLDDFVYEIIRLRIINGVPAILECTFMPIEVIPNLKMKHLETSIYSYIKDDLKLKIQSAIVKISGVNANEQERELLQQEFLMQVEQIVNLDDGRIFEYSKATHIPQEFSFETIIFMAN